MEQTYKKTITVQPEDLNASQCLSLSALLRYAQEISGNHSDLLGHDWDTLAAKNLFWAVLRHRVVIRRLPVCGEEIRLETWPMPATRAAYPRCVRAFDKSGNVLFETVSLWVLMNMQTRTMVLPGKSGVDVPGIIRGDEPEFPGSLAPGTHEKTSLWKVSPRDLDVNGHVNNAKYLDHIEPLIGMLIPTDLTVCYLAEALLHQQIRLQWSLSPEGILSLDGTRIREDAPEKTERVFGVKLCCSVNQTKL